MIELSCDRCRARHSTNVVPRPGQPHRISCACGNTLVFEAGSIDPHARLLEISQLEIAPPPDDPFAPAPRRTAPRPAVPGAPVSAARSVAGAPAAPRRASSRAPVMPAALAAPAPSAPAAAPRRLAERDPDALEDESAEYAAMEGSGEYRASGAATEALLRRARLQGFLSGAAAGAVAAVGIAALLALATSRPERRTTTFTSTVAAPQEPAAAEPAAAAPQPPQRESAPSQADPGRRAATPRRASGDQAPAPRRAPVAPAATPLGVDLVPAAADRAPPPSPDAAADRFGAQERDAPAPAAAGGQREKLR